MLPLIMMLAGFAGAKELPAVKLPQAYNQCKADADCAVAGDACRSCGTLIAVNKKFLKKFAELDRKQREKQNFNPACEACGTQDALLKCVENRCAVSRKETP